MKPTTTTTAVTWRRPYWRDRLAQGALLAYLLNRWIGTVLVPDPESFVQCYLGDVLCLPACVPLVLWLQRRLGMRRHDGPPSLGELLQHWILWSWCFEVLGPRLPALAPGAVADPWDVVAYGAGGLMGAIWWRSCPGRGARTHDDRWGALAPRAGGIVGRWCLAVLFAVPVLLCYHVRTAGRGWLGTHGAVEHAQRP